MDPRGLGSDTGPVAVTEPIRHSSTRARVVAVNDGVRSERTDSLATEEPLEIRVQGPGQEQAQVAVTMRTPGGDFELAVGFLFTEGLIAPGDVKRVAYCDNLPGEDQRYNVVSVTLERPFDAERLRRNFYANSSCGVCGKAALEDIEVRCEPVAPGPEVDLAVLVSLPDRLREAQAVFERTGGLHAAGLFDPAGTPLAVREDVGRHNAVDKVVGERYLAGRLPADGTVLQVSGRASFEIVQKAAVAGIPIVSAVSAPSSLAVEAAERFGMTLVGFVRDGRANVYSHAERVSPPEPRPGFLNGGIESVRSRRKGARLDEERAHTAHRADGPRERRPAHGDLGRGPRPGRGGSAGGDRAERRRRGRPVQLLEGDQRDELRRAEVHASGPSQQQHR